MSLNQQSSQHFDDGTSQDDQPPCTLISNDGTLNGSHDQSTQHDGSLSRASSEAKHYESGYNKAFRKFCYDPDPKSLDVLSAYARSVIESHTGLSTQDRTEGSKTMDTEAHEGLKLWPVFLVFVHSTKPAWTVLEAEKLTGMEALVNLEKELVDTAEKHNYPTYIHSRDDWTARLITAVSAAGTSLDNWTSDTLGRFFKLHRDYSLNNLVQMNRLMRAAQQRNKTRSRASTRRGQQRGPQRGRVEKRQ